jgi:chloride channel 7
MSRRGSADPLKQPLLQVPGEDNTPGKRRRRTSHSGPPKTLVQQRWDKARNYAFQEAREKLEKKRAPWLNLLNYSRRLREEHHGRKIGAYEKVQTLDYAQIDNEAWRTYIQNVTEKDRNRQIVLEFVMVGLVGLTTGAVTKLMLMVIEEMTNRKLAYLVSHFTNLPFATAALMFACTNALVLLLASIPCWYICPPASGGGIPEVKSYLNGVTIHGAFSFKTMLNKILSTVFACSAGMPLGPEAPIIHLGACIGSLYANAIIRLQEYITGGEMEEDEDEQVSCWKAFVRKIFPKLQFENFLEFRKVCMTLGVAGGVAAAFGAPVGGLLFTCEEILALDKGRQWMAFIASTLSFTILRVLSGSATGLFHVDSGHWPLHEWPFVVILGIIMGFFGAGFSKMNILINKKWRMAYVNPTMWKKPVEVIALAFVFSMLWCGLPHFFPCLPLEKGSASWPFVMSTFCDDPEKEWNPLATVVVTPLEPQVKNFFLYDAEGDKTGLGMEVGVYGLVVMCVICTLAGHATAHGIFIPMFVIGGAIGRGYGCIIDALFPTWHINTAAYAICGSAGFLGGVTHMAVALSVVMLEITNDFEFLLPILLVVLFAKGISDSLVHPLFDMMIELKHIPFLEDEPTLTMHKIRCYHCMHRNIISLPVVTTVREIINVLNDGAHSHNGFPVVDDTSSKMIRGLVLRSHLVVILTEKLFEGDEDDELENAIKYTPTHWRLLCDKTHSTPKLEDFTEEELEDDVNLKNFMSRAPYIVNEESPLSRAFELFRKENLRHLPVVNDKSQVTGMITRHDLVDVQHHGDRYEHQSRTKHMDSSALIKKATELELNRQESQRAMIKQMSQSKK